MLEERKEITRRRFLQIASVAPFGAKLLFDVANPRPVAAEKGSLSESIRTYNVPNLPPELTDETAPALQTWGSFNLDRRMLVTSEAPITPDKDLLPGSNTLWTFTPPGILIPGEMGVISARIAVEGDEFSTGIFHGVARPSADRIITGVEVRRGRELFGVVRTDSSNEPLWQEQVGEFPAGTTEFNLSLVTADNGASFGVFDLKGKLQKFIDLVKPAVEPGTASTVMFWKSNSTPTSVMTACAVATPSQSA